MFVRSVVGAGCVGLVSVAFILVCFAIPVEAGWWFLNTWPGSQFPTALGPFRSLSQCNMLRNDAALVGAVRGPCHNNKEAAVAGWWFFIKQDTIVPPTGEGSVDQASCDARRKQEQADGGVVSATCWPST